LLTAAKMDSRNAFGAPEQVRPVPFAGAHWVGGKLRVRMPAKSIVVLTLK
jgi:alpha-N-arabinofuranosidase